MDHVVVETERGVRWSRLQVGIVAVCASLGVALRVLGLDRSLLSFDEAFTANVARMPLGDIPDAVRATDSHPPLDYLLRHFFVGTNEAVWLRMPSAAIGVATLAIVVWWMWNRGWFGVSVVAFASFAAIEVLYARQARMYAVVILAGTAAAAVSERWLGDPRTRWALIAGVAILVGSLAHTSMLFLGAGALLVPGRRTDRDAWIWRGAVVAAMGVWLVVWGPSFVEQREAEHASWIPYTSLRGAVEAVAGQVSLYSSLDLFVAFAVVAGGVVLVKTRPTLGRVWVCLFALPALAVIVLGFRVHLLLPRTLAFAAWGPVLALAALAAACADGDPWPSAISRSALMRGIGALVVVALAVPSAARAFSYEEDSAGVRREASAAAEPGDTVVVHPPWLHPLLRWDHGITADGPAPGFEAEDAYSALVPGGEPTRRAWILVPDTYSYRPPAGFTTCSDEPSRTIDEYVLACYVQPVLGP